MSNPLLSAPIQQFITYTIQEDIGEGDHTSLSCIPPEAEGEARLLVKAKGVLAGVDLAEHLFHKMDPELVFTAALPDGSAVEPGQEAFRVAGSARSILMAERLVLNFMQRMSGIATLTHHFVEALEGTSTRILDTRKTTPGLRFFEKWAVRIGGGTNHRMGLYDMIMVKDNHIDFAGGIEAAICRVRNYLIEHQLDLKIEVETRNLEELEEVLRVGGADVVMLDNYSYADTETAVALIDGTVETESSGNITLDTAPRYAACGVDFISSGALTHSVKSLDLSLKADF